MEPNIAVPHNLVDPIVHRINIQAHSAVYHLTDVESVKAKQRLLLDHVPPVSKFLEELLGSLVDSWLQTLPSPLLLRGE